jgi:hypothetical protein
LIDVVPVLAEPGFVAGMLMFLTLSLMICRTVLRKAFLKSAVLHIQRKQNMSDVKATKR